MKVQKKAQKWIEEITAQLPELRVRIARLKIQHKAAKKRWLNTEKDPTREDYVRPYEEYRAVDRELSKTTGMYNMYKLYIAAANGKKKLYANHIMYSDVVPFEVIEMKTATCWVIREMECTEKESSKKERMESFVPGGFCGHFDNYTQEWNIKSKKDGYTTCIRYHSSKTSKGWYGAGKEYYRVEAKPCKFYDFNF